MGQAVNARILKASPENLQIAAQAIREGQVVGMPTETVYGLAGDAFNALALARIFETKDRPTFDPLIIHVGFTAKRVEDLERLGLIDLKKLSPEARARASQLMQTFWPGPLTLVLPKSEEIPDLATSGLPTVALRMPRHSIAQALIAAAQTPLAAPSANRFGRISPTSAQDVVDELSGRIDWVLDGGPCEVGIESSIIAVSEDGSLGLLRPGGLAIEEIEKIAQAKVALPALGKSILAPGMLESHYAPRKKLYLLPDSLKALKAKGSFDLHTLAQKKVALLQLFGTAYDNRPGQNYCLSASQNLQEAAQNLFRILRQMDRSEAEILVSEPCDLKEGLGYAIGDRLRRASSNSELQDLERLL